MVHAVDGVSFDIAAGETLGLVGESGCGKSTTGRCILRLIEPSSGEILFQGRDVTHLEGEALRELRRDMQIIFQDPFASLNPRQTVRGIVGEALIIHRLAAHRAANSRTAWCNCSRRSGCNRATCTASRMSSPAASASASASRARWRCEPKMIVCDEPVSALDVSMQAQVINLLEDLQEKLGLTYLFIAHDLSVVEHISDRVAVMYLGRVVEIAPADALYENPRHPYTEALLSAVPIPDPQVKRQRIVLQGEVPNPIHPPSGCHFHPRCPLAEPRCSRRGAAAAAEHAGALDGVPRARVKARA